MQDSGLDLKAWRKELGSTEREVFVWNSFSAVLVVLAVMAWLPLVLLLVSSVIHALTPPPPPPQPGQLHPTCGTCGTGELYGYFLAILLVPVALGLTWGVWAAGKVSVESIWSAAYSAAWRVLRDSSLSQLILDDAHWTEARYALLEASLFGLPPVSWPKGLRDRLLLAAAGWDTLTAQAAGDSRALGRGLRGTLMRYQWLQQHGVGGFAADMIATRAWIAAVLDFVGGTMDERCAAAIKAPLQATAVPGPSWPAQPPSRLEPLGYDYRLRSQQDRRD